ncbi:MAG: terminase family protein [Acidimicrobiales bacterium]
MTLADDLAAALDPAELCRRVGMVPDPWQLEVLRAPERRIALAIGRQVGKSTCASLLAVHHAVYDPGCLVLMAAPTLRQAGELFRRAMTLYRTLGRPVASETENALSLTLENGSRIVSLPGEERTVRGFAGAALVLIDEAARVDDAMMAALEPMVAISGGRIILMSTPWGKRGFFFYATQDPRWRTFVVRADECPRWKPDDLEGFRDSRGEWLYRQEILAEFIDASGQMFRTDDIDIAIRAGRDGAVTVAPLFGRDGRTALTHHRPEVIEAKAASC